MVACLLSAVTLVAHAGYGGVDAYEEFGKRLRAAQEVAPLTSELFGDSVSLYNRATTFRVTDISIPGNGGLPVQMRRELVIRDRRGSLDSTLAGFGDWDIDVPYIMATVTADNGWMVGGLGSATYNRCSDNFHGPYTWVSIPGMGMGGLPYSVIWDGNHLHIPGEVDEELLTNTQSASPAFALAPTYPWVTKSNYVLRCLSSTQNGMPGEAFVAVSPAGVRTTFDWAVTRQESGAAYVASATIHAIIARSNVYLLATRVEDRFGNWVNYHYSGDHLTQITSSDGRTISLTWSGNTIATVTSALGTWSYSYVNGADGRPRLSRVTQPDSSAWTYGVVSGSLVTVKNDWPGDSRPPSNHCQISPEPNSGSFAYTVGAPSGAAAIYNFVYFRDYQSYVPLSCPNDQNELHKNPEVYNFFDNFALVSKQISGPGLTTQTWTYQTDNSLGRYYTPTASWDQSVQPYIPAGPCPDCAFSKTVTVTGPTEITKYTFGVQYARNEGQLLGVEITDLAGQVLKSTANAYVSDDEAINAPFPNIVGGSILPNYAHPMANRVRPVKQIILSQDGDDYTRLNEMFDNFAQPTKVKRFSSIAGQQALETQITYRNDLAHWVLGLLEQVQNLTTGEVVSSNSYDPTANTLLSRARFGQTLMSFTYDAQGLLVSFTDGNTNTTTLGDYKRGLPQQIHFPDQSNQSVVVNDSGQVTSVTDQAGNTTAYGYDAMGRVNQISYPTGDEVAWFPSTFTYAYVAGAERGIPGGHWRRTAVTGNNTQVTYFDAMLRPLLSNSSISGAPGSDITITNTYDSRGLTTFTSHPVSGTPDWSSVTSGTHMSYDAVGRLTTSQQDSELGQLTTTTAYLSGAGVRVTDPKNNVTTTYHQVFDEPSHGAPIKVVAPAGITQVIARDLYGNPTAITQFGLYNGTESDNVTKTLTYDSYHRLCRTTEPESGSRVMAYDNANNLSWSAEGLSITGTGCGQEQVTTGKTTRTYDTMNRVWKLTPPASTQSTIYTYDALGNPKIAQSGISTWSAAYNKRGQLTGESLQLDGQSAWGIGYAHDAYGSVSLIHYPDGESVSYAPDALGRATQVGSYATGLTYFPDGEVKDFVYGNGAVYAAEKNTRQLVSNFSYGQGATLVVSEDYIYDANGNITKVNDLAGGLRSKVFDYDALNRLSSAQAPGLWGTESYTYDPLNNLRTRITGGQTLTYNYDAFNRLGSISGGAGSTFVYDNRGNVINKNGINLVFDQKNQLTQIQGYGSYAYDAAGRRVKKTSSAGASTYYFYNQAGQLLYQANPETGKATNFVYLGRKLLARNESVQLVAPGAISFDANPNNGSYTVTWGVVPGATSYLLQESANGGGWITVYSGSAASKALSGKAGGSYTYRAEGCVGTTCGDWTTSDTLGVRPALPTVSVPGGTINGTYTVSWTAPASASAYMVQESLNGGAWTTIANSTAANAISRPGTTSGSYTYQVSAYNSYGTRGWAGSGAVTVDTTYGVVPTAPASLTVPASSSTGSATLNWSPASLTTSYVVEQSSNGGVSWTGIYNSNGTSTAVSGLADGSYVFHVQACNAYGCSPWAAGSATLVVTHPPAMAPNLSAPASSTSGGYTVSWGGVSGATSYTLQEQVNGGGWTTVQASGSTSWSISGKASGTYDYQVQACNAGGCGPWSGVSSVLVVIPAPIAIDGQSYWEDYFIPAKQTGSVAMVFAIYNGNTWELYSAVPGATHTKASGSVPSSAATVRFTWTYVGIPGGYQDANGTVTNPASSPVAVSSNPATKYLTMSASGGTPRGRTYQLKVDFFNAAGTNISSSTCTLTAMTEGGF